MATCNPLTPKQIDALPEEMSKEHWPVRFMVDGRSANVCTGLLSAKGSLVICHFVYYERPPGFVRDVLAGLRTNNPGLRVVAASYS